MLLKGLRRGISQHWFIISYLPTIGAGRVGGWFSLGSRDSRSGIFTSEKVSISLFSINKLPLAFTLLGMITMCINCAVLELHDLVSRVANPGPAPVQISPTQSYVECILAIYGNVVIANELKFSFMLIGTMF